VKARVAAWPRRLSPARGRSPARFLSSCWNGNSHDLIERTFPSSVTVVGESELRHFVDLAHHGKALAASEGEQRARRLALVILRHAPGLDLRALAGAADFIHLAVDLPEAASTLVAY
jgi:hypothetical protein